MTNSIPSIPSIFSANTFFWSSGGTANCRRRNEERRLGEAVSFFKSLGLDVEERGSHLIGTGNIGGNDVVIDFHYSESCKNVYKHVSSTRNGRASNMLFVKNAIAKMAAKS